MRQLMLKQPKQLAKVPLRLPQQKGKGMLIQVDRNPLTVVLSPHMPDGELRPMVWTRTVVILIHLSWVTDHVALVARGMMLELVVWLEIGLVLISDVFLEYSVMLMLILVK